MLHQPVHVFPSKHRANTFVNATVLQLHSVYMLSMYEDLHVQIPKMKSVTFNPALIYIYVEN